MTPNEFDPIEDDDNDPLDTPVPPDELPEDGDSEEPEPFKIAYRKELDELSAFLKARTEAQISAARKIQSYRYPGGE